MPVSTSLVIVDRDQPNYSDYPINDSVFYGSDQTKDILDYCSLTYAITHTKKSFV